MGIKSFDQLKAAVEAVALKKQAAEVSTPKDPNEVTVPSKKEEGMISEKCMNVPEGKANDKAVEKETSSLPVKDSSEEAAINPKEEQSLKVTEQTVTKKGSELLKKIQNSLKAKTAAAEETKKPVEKVAMNDNVASGIDLSVDALAKIASEILNTEEGAKFTTNLFRKKAGEEYARQAIKEASEQAALYKKQEEIMKNSPIAKIASEIDKLPEEEQKIFMHRLETHVKNINSYEHEILKRAYAAGAEDAEGVIQDPSVLESAKEPSVEEAGAAEITPEEVMEAISEMVDAGEIDEATANQVIEEIVGAADEAAAEEASEEGNAPAAAADEAAAADALNAAAAEGPAKLASEIVKGTILLKKASAELEGKPEEEEASLEDVISVIQALQEEGSISEEDAANVISEIADAIDQDDSEKEAVEEEETEEPEDEDVDVSEEVEKVASELGVK